MDRRINKTVETYITGFKNDVRDKSIELGINTPDMNSLLQFIYDYERLSFDKEDFIKRKRVKNSVPVFDRCCAKRANDEQCTRRKKNENYCGTHIKGIPHGNINSNKSKSETQTSYKIEVCVKDINGIIYYIDKNGNIYQVEDIISNNKNPKIIGKYTIQGIEHFH